MFMAGIFSGLFYIDPSAGIFPLQDSRFRNVIIHKSNDSGNLPGEERYISR